MTGSRVAEIRLAALAPLLAEIEVAGLYWLSAEERSRWQGMRSETRRRQFLAGHWLIRCLAADALGGDPTQWLLESAANGAPILRSPTRNEAERVCVSLSHSAESIVVALAPFPIGVDLEGESKPRDLLALADATFSPRECAELRQAPDSERAALFYLRWTLKEATGKREGHGLRPELARRQQPVECAAGDAEIVSWQFADRSLALAGETGMAVRATGMPETTRARHWRIESVPT